MRRSWMSAVAAGALTVACTSTGPTGVAVDPGRAPLPTLPPRTADGGPGAATTEPQAVRDARAGTSVEDWRQLGGFEGRFWTEDVTSELKVLMESIHVDGGTAFGLVRNEHPFPVGPVVVRAGDRQTEVLVPVIRPGEPAPFRLDLGDINPDAVAGLEWSATGEKAGSLTSRDVRFAIYWTRGVDDPRSADTYLHEDPDEGPRPYVAFGTAEAFGPVADLRVIGAWLDGDGKILRVSEGTTANEDLEPGDITDFVVTGYGPATLDEARLMLWATGS